MKLAIQIIAIVVLLSLSAVTAWAQDQGVTLQSLAAQVARNSKDIVLYTNAFGLLDARISALEEKFTSTPDDYNADPDGDEACQLALRNRVHITTLGSYLEKLARQRPPHPLRNRLRLA